MKIEISTCVFTLFIMVEACGNLSSDTNLTTNVITNNSDTSYLILLKEDNIELQETKVDMSILSYVQSKINDVYDTSKMDVFIMSFEYAPFDNVEYGEFANELLFELTKKKTKCFIQILSDFKGQKCYDNVLREFSSPLSDTYQLDEIIKLLRTDTINNGIANDIIASLHQ